MPQGPRPEKPYRLRHTRLALSNKVCKNVENEYLRAEKWLYFRLYEGGAQKTQNTLGVQLMLNHELPRFSGSFKLLRKSYSKTENCTA